MAFVYITIASTMAALVNLCLRKNIQYGGSIKSYLCLYFWFSFLSSFFLFQSPRMESFSTLMTTAGSVTGILNYIMIVLVAKAVLIGPSGLTFAFQNSGSILPAFALFVLFGASFGFVISVPLLIGFCSILCGLFLSSRKQKDVSDHQPKKSNFFQWFSLAIIIFFVQGVILTLFQWKELLYLCEPKAHVLLPWRCINDDQQWFLPGFFFIPSLIQTWVFVVGEKRWFSLKEGIFGTAAGVLNGGAAFFLLFGLEHASGGEKLILFPLFSIMVIFFCDLWGRMIYKEKIHWVGTALCAAGVLIGAL